MSELRIHDHRIHLSRRPAAAAAVAAQAALSFASGESPRAQDRRPGVIHMREAALTLTLVLTLALSTSQRGANCRSSASLIHPSPRLSLCDLP